MCGSQLSDVNRLPNPERRGDRSQRTTILCQKTPLCPVTDLLARSNLFPFYNFLVRQMLTRYKQVAAPMNSMATTLPAKPSSYDNTWQTNRFGTETSTRLLHMNEVPRKGNDPISIERDIELIYTYCMYLYSISVGRTRFRIPSMSS